MKKYLTILAALLVAAMPGVTTNTSIRFAIRNTGADHITLTASTGITISASTSGTTSSIVDTVTGQYLLILTNVTPGNEAGVCYAIGADGIW